MSIALPTVRYYTANSPYHYTTDNEPLQDLAARDDAIALAVEDFSKANQVIIGTGTWGTIVPFINCTPLAGKPFAFRVRLWAIENQSIGVSQNSTLSEDLIFGSVDVDTNVTILSTINKFKHGAGTQANYSYVTTGGGINVPFTVYSGANGYILIKVEHYTV